ncbi:MAG: allantoicase [Actinomycetota bacterium]|jgi:allantoicase|nr:allantoicase [Actinomycetota bacterium]MDQ1642841.1 allantoicase [Actinomycetota bacterium]
MAVDFTTLPVLSDERLGSAVVGRNDEFFALADNLLKSEAPVFVADRFTKRGKWMDGWETRRRRTPGVDWCIVRLGAGGLVRGVVVDTAHFTGNFPKECWLEGCSVDGYPSAEELADAEWMPLGSRTPLSGDHKHLINVSLPARITHVRLTINPDGGIARLRVHGEPVPDPRDVWGMPLDLAALEHGGVVTDCSDMYFSHRHNLNLPTSPQSMADGWETRRRRGPGNDWVVVRLVEEGVLRIAEVDTRFFKGNAPGSFSLDGRGEGDWRPLLGETGLRPHMRHRFRVPPHDPVSQVRLNIYPDGGVARLRLWGALSQSGAEALGLRWLETLTQQHAVQELLAVCGSREWASKVAAGRPYGSLAEVREAAGVAWHDLSRDDWLEAFAAHPRLGDRSSPGGSAWARQEQAGTAGAASDVLAALEEGNREYERRFGHVFLLFATGLSAAEMYTALRSRLDNDAETELQTAAGEQEKINDLRLQKLLTP